MAYQCLDCGYKSAKQFPGGKCPACHSYKISGGHAQKSTSERSPRRKAVDLCVLLACWGVLAYLLVNKLF